MKTVLSLSIYILMPLLLFAQNTGVVQIEKWEIFELSLKGPSRKNAFIKTEFSAEFKKDQKIIKMNGFYDGDGDYKIRFMPQEIGEWTYKTSSNKNDLNNKEGKFICINPSKNNHGFVKISGKNSFSYADGKIFIPFGISALSWVHQKPELQQQTIASIKNSPFNKIKMCIFPVENVYNSGELKYLPFPRKKGENDFEKFDTAFFKQLDKDINALKIIGIEAELVLFHPYDKWGLSNLDKETETRYLKYLISRYAAFKNIWWTVAYDYDVIKNKNKNDWEEIFKFISENDPYHHLKSIQGKNERINLQSIDYQIIANTDFNKIQDYIKDVNRPFIFENHQHEGNIKENWGNIIAREVAHRAWISIIAGGYFGYSEAFKDISNNIFMFTGGNLQGESIERIKFLKKLTDEAPGRLEVLNQWAVSAGDDYYLYYFKYEQPSEYQYSLAKNFKYKAEIFNVINMESIEVKDIENGITLKLPKKPHIAVKIKKSGFLIPENLILMIPNEGLFTDSVRVELINPKYKEIRYTLNEEKPDKSSYIYTTPILLTSNTLVKAKGFGEGQIESLEVCSDFKKTSYLKSEKELKGLENGLKFSYFEGEWPLLPNFNKMKPEKRGIIGKFDTFPKTREENYGFVYKGYLSIDEDNIYSFYIKSNNNCRLFIDNLLILENKATKDPFEIKNQIALEKGLHQIKIEMNHQKGQQILEVSYESRKIEKQAISGKSLFFK